MCQFELVAYANGILLGRNILRQKPTRLRARKRAGAIRPARSSFPWHAPRPTRRRAEQSPRPPWDEPSDPKTRGAPPPPPPGVHWPVTMPIHCEMHLTYPDECAHATHVPTFVFAFLELLTWGSWRHCGGWSPADTDKVRASSRGGALGLMMAALPKRRGKYSQARGRGECFQAKGLNTAQDHAQACMLSPPRVW